MLTCSLFYSEEVKVINSVPLDLHLGLKETVKIGNMCRLWLLEHESLWLIKKMYKTCSLSSVCCLEVGSPPTPFFKKIAAKIPAFLLLLLMLIFQRTRTVSMTQYASNILSIVNDFTTSESAAAAKSLQSCLTLRDPIDGSPPGSPVPGILQARTLKWVAISFSNAWKWKVKVKSLSCVRLLATPWTAAYQAPPPMGFSRQEYWSGVPLPSPLQSLNHSLPYLSL